MLIEYGVDPFAPASVSPNLPFFNCLTLEQSGKTSMMFAAENDDVSLFSYLLQLSGDRHPLAAAEFRVCHTISLPLRVHQ
jgi:hypothetical protein